MHCAFLCVDRTSQDTAEIEAPLLDEDVALDRHCLQLPECLNTNQHLLLSVRLVSAKH